METLSNTIKESFINELEYKNHRSISPLLKLGENYYLFYLIVT